MTQSMGRLLEDPVKEIQYMQLLGTNHQNVLGSIEVSLMQEEKRKKSE